MGNESAGAATQMDMAVLREIAEGTARSIGGEFLQSLVKHLSAATGARYAFVAEFAGSRRRVRTLAYWNDGKIVKNVEFDLAGTPCEEVVQGSMCHYPAGVKDRFPRDRALMTMGIEGYLGVPLLDKDGEALGHLAVFNNASMPEDQGLVSVFRIFAARAAAELERVRLEEQRLYLQEEIKSLHDFEQIVGRSGALQSVLESVRQVAPTEASALILGETGTGKELIARAIHSAGKRKDRPLIKVNCAALATSLVESELFGHERGAFSGAVAKRVGRFELASGGTIFLDEVGEIPLEVQAKLLRVIQEREFERVGGSVSIKTDVRIIAATNRDLTAAIGAGKFREDLYYRLNVFPISIPPLRERREDIPLLVRFLIERFAARMGRQVKEVSEETMRRLMEYAWPGNVRELENVIERAVILAKGPVVEVRLAEQPGATGAAAPAMTLDALERSHIVSVLKSTDWVVEGSAGAAEILWVHPNTLRSRLKRMGIQRDGYEVS